MKKRNTHLLRRGIAAVLAGMSLLGSATDLHAQAYGDPNQPYDRLPGTHETYHVKWMKPYAGGTLKVLFIISYPQSREVIEAAQRLDLDYTVIMCSGHKTWSTVRMDASGGRQLQTCPGESTGAGGKAARVSR